jgi:lysophospholipase L1-like esterase
MPRVIRLAAVAYLLILHAAVLVLLVSPTAAEWATKSLRGRPSGWEAPQFWQQMVVFHQRLDRTLDHAVLFFGDSLVQSLDVSAVADRAANYGIGADTIEGMMHRLTVYQSIPRARAVVLAIGINDLLLHDAASVAADYARLIDEFPQEVPLVLSLVLPVEEAALRYKAPFRNNSEIRSLNARISGFCRMHARCTVSDVSSDLVDARGNLRREFHEGDGLHLSAEGYRVWISALRRSLNELITR